ncbi:DUF2273 domain-containing protein [Nocardioides alkalitolerans]|uniref:DUF2273 domain-containing protein n=1 Tax=Nocardioides alkalitolerans TaxID=281714 RepID=UPI00041E30E6|nr:DUF2273 domain-containing protein [Nocardioides alkalitolerans]
MSHAATGLLAGLLIAVVAVVGGFTGFLLAVVLGGVGLAVGLQLDGRVDLREVVRGRPE